MPPNEDARAILLLALQDFAAKARYSPAATPLPATRKQILAQIRQMRAELEKQLAEWQGDQQPPKSFMP